MYKRTINRDIRGCKNGLKLFLGFKSRTQGENLFVCSGSHFECDVGHIFKKKETDQTPRHNLLENQLSNCNKEKLIQVKLLFYIKLMRVSNSQLMWIETGSSHVLLVGLEAQVMKFPGGQIHIQARRVQLVPIALEHIVVEYIRQLPCSSSQVVPGQMNTCLRLVL
jgi:hypothetical protein